MDPKTRMNFDMNIWNPTAAGAINLTDNQIYETCDNFLDGENHYCRPVPSRQTSGVLTTTSTSPLTMKSAKMSCSKLKCVVGVVGVFILVLSLVFISIGCGGYAILEIQRLKGEVGVLRSDIAALRLAQGADVANLNETISTEVQNRATQFADLEVRLLSTSSELAKQLAGNYSLLSSDIQNGLSSLSADFQGNLTLLTNLSSLDLVNLANDVKLNITIVSDDLERLEKETDELFSNLQDSVKLNISSLQASMLLDLQNLADVAEEGLASLNSSFAEGIRQTDSAILSLDRAAYRNISQLSVNQKRDSEHLTSLIMTSIAVLRSTTMQNISELSTSISRLRDDAYSNVSSLENDTTTAISLITDELSRIEVELALEAHGNLSRLSLDLRVSLSNLSLSFQRVFVHLEEEFQGTFVSIMNETDTRIAGLEAELQMNMTLLRQSTAHFVNQTFHRLDQVEENVNEDLSTLSMATYHNLSTLSSITEQNIAQLENSTRSSLSELGAIADETRQLLHETALQAMSNLSHLRQEFKQALHLIRMDLQTGIGELNSSDSQILNVLQNLDVRINGTLEELNITGEMVLLLVSSEADTLRASLAGIERNLSSTSYQVLDLNRQLQDQLNLTNASIIGLQGNILSLAQETYNNLTQLSNVDAALTMTLNTLAEESRENISDLLTLSRSEIQEARDEASANLTRLADDVMETLSITNTSLHREISNISLATNGMITLLKDEVSNSLVGVYSYVNNSIFDITIELGSLGVAISNVSSTVSANSGDVTALVQAFTNDTISLINDVKVNLTMNIIDLAHNIDTTSQEFNSHVRLLRADINSLEIATNSNFTELQGLLMHEISLSENRTRTDLATSTVETQERIENLRSTIYDNISESNGALIQMSRDLNISLLNAIDISSAENQYHIERIIDSTETNITLLRGELDALSLNILSVKGQVENLTSQQSLASGSINSLNSSIHELGLDIATTRGGVSDVADEVELLHDTVTNHLNSTVNLFGGCVEDVSSCSRLPDIREYESHCETQQKEINVAVIIVCGRGGGERGKGSSEGDRGGNREGERGEKGIEKRGRRGGERGEGKEGRGEGRGEGGEGRGERGRRGGKGERGRKEERGWGEGRGWDGMGRNWEMS
jgi:hypothetical protein